MQKIVLTVLLSASLLFSIAAPSKVEGKDPDIRGRITKIRPPSTEGERRFPGAVMVEAENKTAKVDKANLIITDKTRILKERDDQRVQATFEELKVGQLVEAQFVEGPTIMIYPLQVAAAEIVILSAGVEKNQ
jgi:hypothetical protein